MLTMENDKNEKQLNNENTLGDSSASSFKQAINTIEHKIKSLEKQKAELESYRELHTTPKINEANKFMYRLPAPGAGFIDSFLKFLENGQVTTPPTASKGGRRQSWKRPKTLQQSEVRSDFNGTHTAPIPSPISRLTQSDSQDDLPVPKERKGNSFDSSDDGFSSDDNFANKKLSPTIKSEPSPKEKNSRRGRTPKTVAERKKARSHSPVQEWEGNENLRAHQQKQVPRRESSKRAAKDKCVIKRLMASDEETGETSDSDSDPAWMPQVKEDPEDDVAKSSMKKRKRGRPAGRRKTIQNSVTKASEEPDIENNSQQLEITKRNEETTDTDSETAWTLQAKGDSEHDTMKPVMKKRKRGRPAGRRKAVQNSVITAIEQPAKEDSDSQPAETEKTEEKADSDSDPAWTSHAKENAESEAAKLTIKKGKRSGQIKSVENSDTTPQEPTVENSDTTPQEPTVENKDSQLVDTIKNVEETADSELTPQMKEDSEDDAMKTFEKKGKRREPVSPEKAIQNSDTMMSEEPVDEDINTQPIEEIKRQKSSDKVTPKVSNVQASENNSCPHMVHANLPEDGMFKFVVMKSELKEEWPAIWRIDGKSLLQKYEPFIQNGQTLYRNISTFISWIPESKTQYIPIPVKYRSQSRLETVVEFLKNEMTVVDYEFLERTMRENKIYQDSFEVYIQALISQALDANFLKEIIQEQDDYFLSRVKTIDEITNSKRQKLLCILRWPYCILVAVSTWPCFNIIRELSISDAENKFCAACLFSEVSVQVVMYGQPYNSTTLEGCQPDPHIPGEKNFLMCRLCANRIRLFNKIIHQKYLLYMQCAKRVAIKRTADPHKDTTRILNEFLADDNWLNQLFLEVRITWGEVDSLYLQYQEPRNSIIPML